MIFEIENQVIVKATGETGEVINKEDLNNVYVIINSNIKLFNITELEFNNRN
ncbi:MAG: hypothetical protein JWN56_1213 [Sphingobacteriales bacterium]|nr:hypothetical protein [Sphingobacteriales bacterium]